MPRVYGITRLMSVGTLALPVLWSCGSNAGADRASAKAPPAKDAPAKVRPAAKVVASAALPEGCELIPIAEIERIAGPLEGQPKSEGSGCRYYFPFDSSGPEWAKLREWERRVRASAGADTQDLKPFQPQRPELFVDVDVSGDAQVMARAASAAFKRMTAEGGFKKPSTEPPAGWDAVGTPLGRGGFTGRVGHVTITIASQRLRTPADSIKAMAARLRDRIPDRPFPYPGADPSASPPEGNDPCSVLTRAEAETVLGKLAVPPFRTHEGSPLADPTGKSCAYFTPGHRVLVLTPEWELGKMSMNAERMVGGLIGQLVDLGGPLADTLEGPWDEAAVGASGDVILRKGPRSLTIGYLLSATDAAGAIKLGGPALKRLAAQPGPARRSIPDDGCLPARQVGQILDSPVRLASKVMSPQRIGVCLYQLEEDLTVTLELSIQPARAAQATFEDLQSNAMDSPAERIDVGEGGWAFDSRSVARAAAVRAGRTYHAHMNDPIGSSARGRKDAMVRLIAKMME